MSQVQGWRDADWNPSPHFLTSAPCLKAKTTISYQGFYVIHPGSLLGWSAIPDLLSPSPRLLKVFPKQLYNVRWHVRLLKISKKITLYLWIVQGNVDIYKKCDRLLLPKVILQIIFKSIWIRLQVTLEVTFSTCQQHYLNIEKNWLPVFSLYWTFILTCKGGNMLAF